MIYNNKKAKLKLFAFFVTSTLSAVFCLLSFCSIAQRPMPKEFVLTKIDSIVTEANLLYFLTKSKSLAKAKFKEEKSIPFEKIKLTVYLHRDSCHVIFSDSNLNCLYKVGFIQNSEQGIVLSSITRPLFDFEDSVIKTHDYLINKALKKQQPLELKDQFSLDYCVFSNQNEIKVYQLTLTDEKGIIPFGNDKVLLFDFKNNLKEIIEFYDFKPTSISAKTEIIMVVYNAPTPYIFATDICKFRLYHDFGIDSFTAYSRRNKLNFEYHLQNNSIDVHR